jgi:hypothetical protein
MDGHHVKTVEVVKREKTEEITDDELNEKEKLHL